MQSVNFHDACAVRMRGAIDDALAKLQGKLPEAIFLQANLYADSIISVVSEFADEAIKSGLVRRIENATCNTELDDAERWQLIEECLAAVIACRDECRETSVKMFPDDPRR